MWWWHISGPVGLCACARPACVCALMVLPLLEIRWDDKISGSKCTSRQDLLMWQGQVIVRSCLWLVGKLWYTFLHMRTHLHTCLPYWRSPSFCSLNEEGLLRWSKRTCFWPNPTCKKCTMDALCSMQWQDSCQWHAHTCRQTPTHLPGVC